VLRDRLAAAGLTALVSVDSAGTGDWHIGQGANAKSITTLNQYGYDLDHTARQITPSWFADIDLALVMDTNNFADVAAQIEISGAQVELRMMRAFDPALSGITEPDPALDVPDPYHGTLEDFTTVLKMIESASDGLVSELALRVS
jgi:protein-tyrosine phosphatase